MNTNGKAGMLQHVDGFEFWVDHSPPGEIELTFMNSFCRAANFRNLLSREEMPDAIRGFLPIIQNRFGRSDVQGTMMRDILSLCPDTEGFTWDSRTKCRYLEQDLCRYLLLRINRDESPSTKYSFSFLPHGPEVHLLDRSVQDKNELVLKGVTYRKFRERREYRSTDSHDRAKSVDREAEGKYKQPRGVGDSMILFLQDNRIRPGRISDMFIHSRTADHVVEFFLVVDVFGELSDSDALGDPYRKHPLLEVKLYRADFVERLVIKSSDIVSHFASCPYGERTDLQVVLSLDRSGECASLPTSHP